MSGTPTVFDLRREIAAMLGDASDTPALDARLIVAHALGLEPGEVIFRDGEAVVAVEALKARNLGRRRAMGEPVARLTGEQEFYGLRLMLSPETLIPRQDTETLVDAVLNIVFDRESPVAILDLGTGSGAILLALLSQLPNAGGLGVDRAEGAARAARANAQRLGFGDRAAFMVGNWTDAIEPAFNIVVANPPYIASGDIAGLAVDVRAHDPHMALDGGADGLDAVRAIFSDLDRVLAEGGAAFIEVGFDQADAVSEIAASRGFGIAFQRDLQGIARVAVVSRESDTSPAVG